MDRVTTPAAGPLAGIRVLELAGLAPGPFAGMMLADHGAEVLRVDRVHPLAGGGDLPGGNPLDRGKRTIGLDLKHPQGVEVFHQLATRADVVIEVFRPGVAERLGIGPEDLFAVNRRLVYGRLTGWGQDGPLAGTAGHDIDYIAIAGVLSACGRAGQPPTPPLNILGDFAGGGLMLAYGIVCALLQRERTGVGQIVDAAMVDGAALLGTTFFAWAAGGGWGPRGTNLLDSGAPFYDVYETADGKYVAVGPLEPQFWEEFRTRLAAGDLPARENPTDWPELRKRLTEIFASRTREEWTAIFSGSDACVAPVLDLTEAPDHPHNRARGTFIEVQGVPQAGPAPRLSGSARRRPGPAASLDDLTSWGLSVTRTSELRDAGVLT